MRTVWMILWGIATVAGWSDTQRVILMPTAYTNEPRTLFLATEQIGNAKSYGKTRTRNLYTQFQWGSRLDFGVDLCNFDQHERQ